MYAIDPEPSAHRGELDATDVSNVDAARAELRTIATRTRWSADQKPVKVRDVRAAGARGQPAITVHLRPPHSTARHGDCCTCTAAVSAGCTSSGGVSCSARTVLAV